MRYYLAITGYVGWETQLDGFEFLVRYWLFMYMVLSVKHVTAYDLSHSLENCKMRVEHFANARVKCILYLRKNLHHLIINVDTKDTSTNRRLEKIAKSIVELPLSVRSNSCDVTLSNITVRNDGHQQKVVETNRRMKELCKK